MDPRVLLTWHEALSGIFGSISLASWIFLLVPQLIENYQQGSADGISITFLLIWAAGDVLNLAGALWARLVPTVIALAVYFCFADGILILQCLYYHFSKKEQDLKEQEIHGNEHTNGAALEVDEETSLLDNASSPRIKKRASLTEPRVENFGLPGSRRRSSVISQRRPRSDNQERENSENVDEVVSGRTWLKNAASVLAILIIGTAGWAIAYKTGAWSPSPVSEGDEGDDTPIGAEILGYASAVLYLGARIPQILKNQRERSCEGLSLLFFLLSIIGNATYGAGILFHSIEKTYFLTNLPWLIGSLGTMVEDAIIFAQFSSFGENRKDLPAE